MDNNNSNFQGHPFYVALALFNAAVRTPLDIATAFWRPWFADAGKRKVQDMQRAEASPVEVSLPKTETQIAAIAQRLAGVAEKVPRPSKRKQTPKPKPKKVAVEKEAYATSQAHVERRAGTGARRASPKDRALAQASPDKRCSQPEGAAQQWPWRSEEGLQALG